MSRNLNAQLEGFYTSSVILSNVAVEMFLSNGTARFWTGKVFATFNGQEYAPTFGAGTISTITNRGTQIATDEVTLECPFNPAYIAMAHEVSGYYRNRPIKFYDIVFDTEKNDGTYQMENWFNGRMNTFNISEKIENGIITEAKITLHTINCIIDVTKADDEYYTEEHQKRRCSARGITDTAFRHLLPCLEKELPWGDKTVGPDGIRRTASTTTTR
jgi:hypothetical protein